MELPAHLLQIRDLSVEQVRFFFNVARALRPFASQGESVPLLKNSTIANLFFEPSTRTRSSFETAARKLGASCLNFSSSTSSQKKGETLIDTARVLEAMHPNCIVVRHASAGSPFLLSRHLKTPIVNAGDGFHEHPTQALLDALTIEDEIGSLKDKKVVIIGDIAHSRVARSNIHLLKMLGASVSVSGPPTLMPPFPETLGVTHSYRPEPLLEDADVVMTLRIHFERQNPMQIPSVNEYRHFWGLNLERANLLKKDAVILDPGPINRGIQIDPQVADGPRSLILNQVANGVVIRMAILAGIVNPKGLQEWINQR